MSNANLVTILQDIMAHEGPIPFARFMELALYHPEQGYYATPRPKIGPQGDYYTSPGVHPVFAQLLAKQFVQMMEQGLCNDPLTLIEFGPGDGLLCQGIIQCIEETFPTYFKRLHYMLIETSVSFRERQKERLLPRYAAQVQWEDQIPSSCVGIVLAHEFLDALPVHRLRLENNAVYEVYVTWNDGFIETLRPPSSQELVDYIKNVGLLTPTGLASIKPMTLEVNLRALDWIRHIGQALQQGYVVIFDYGYPAQYLYDPKRREGTLICYHKHRVNDNPYDFIGEQDMTSHVDFTSLAQAGKSSGLNLLGWTDQTHFLMGLGIAQEMQKEAETMEHSETARKNFLAMKQLMAPDRMGKVFKVLLCAKAVSSTVPLDGLHFPAFPQEDLLGFDRRDRI